MKYVGNVGFSRCSEVVVVFNDVRVLSMRGVLNEKRSRHLTFYTRFLSR